MAGRVSLPLFLLGIVASGSTLPAQEPARASGAELTQSVLAIFTKHCDRCHGPKAGEDFDEFDYILDLRKLARTDRLVDLQEPEASLLYTKVRDDKMPKGRKKLDEKEKAVILAWLRAGAPPETLAPDAAPERPFVSNDDVLKAVLQDLLALQEEDRFRVATARYFMLTHFHNNREEVSDEELALFRYGLFKLLNSISRRPAIVRPEPVDPHRTVFRVDIEDLGWPEELWERVMVGYPYALESTEGLSRAVATFTSTRLPIARGDWFVFVASQPPLYHEFLDVEPEGPSFEKDPSQRADRKLEERLGVDVLGNLRRGRAVRAGFAESGVSQNNRLIERHEIGTYPGAYWVSYDFASSTGNQSLKDRPLGPPELKRRFAFHHDGGETIFSLPNGLQGYLLVTGAGKRLDVAPSNIVHDRSNPRGGFVLNGISCMGCHADGMRDERFDEIRERVLATPAVFEKDELDLLLALYRPRDELGGLFAADRRRFLEAEAEATGADQGPKSEKEPVRFLFDRFAAIVRLPAAAAELGLGVDDVESRASRASVDVRGLVHDLATSGIHRERFVAAFGALVKGLGLGTHRGNFEPIQVAYWGGGDGAATTSLATASAGEGRRAGEEPTTPPADEGRRAGEERSDNGLGMKLVWCPPGSFRMGSPPGEVGRDDDEGPVDVRLTRGFWIGKYEVTQEEWFKVLATRPWKGKGRGVREGSGYPATYVSWLDAMDFCRELTRMERDAGRLPAGIEYTLPTEAQWEYACRAGTKTRFYFGDGEAVLGAHAWFKGSMESFWFGYEEVGRKRANPWGLHDVHGNVAEWCRDEYYEELLGGNDPERSGSQGSDRVSRGGGWNDSPQGCRAADRFWSSPSVEAGSLGFRVARVLVRSSR